MRIYCLEGFYPKKKIKGVHLISHEELREKYLKFLPKDVKERMKNSVIFKKYNIDSTYLHPETFRKICLADEIMRKLEKSERNKPENERLIHKFTNLTSKQVMRTSTEMGKILNRKLSNWGYKKTKELYKGPYVDKIYWMDKKKKRARLTFKDPTEWEYVVKIPMTKEERDQKATQIVNNHLKKGYIISNHLIKPGVPFMTCSDLTVRDETTQNRDLLPRKTINQMINTLNGVGLKVLINTARNGEFRVKNHPERIKGEIIGLHVDLPTNERNKAIKTIFPHGVPVRTHYVVQKRLLKKN